MLQDSWRCSIKLYLQRDLLQFQRLDLRYESTVFGLRHVDIDLRQ